MDAPVSAHDCRGKQVLPLALFQWLGSKDTQPSLNALNTGQPVSKTHTENVPFDAQTTKPRTKGLPCCRQSSGLLTTTSLLT